MIGGAIDFSCYRGRSRISGKGVLMYKSVRVRFADFSQISHENEIIWSH